jgi:hypothetical protein
MTRRRAPLGRLAYVECLWDEVFTGIQGPAKLKKGERAKLPLQIAAILIARKAARNVGEDA